MGEGRFLVISRKSFCGYCWTRLYFRGNSFGEKYNHLWGSLETLRKSFLCDCAKIEMIELGIWSVNHLFATNFVVKSSYLASQKINFDDSYWTVLNFIAASSDHRENLTAIVLENVFGFIGVLPHL